MNSTSVRRHCPIMSLVLAMGACVFVQGQENNPEGNEESSAPPTIAERVKDLQKHEGLLTFYTDTRKGKVLLELPAAQGPRGLLGEYLYIEGLLQGLGSNPVGLDRGKLGPDRLVHFRHVGGRVLIEHINLRYRALSDNQDEQNAVRQSFATSVIWAGEIEIEDPDGRLLIDFTSFLVRDAHNVVTTLKRSGQGSYSLDEKRSVIDLVNCLAFPENLEFEAVLTFAGSEPGRDVRSTTPTPESISLVQHHSLVKLPDSNYRPRKHDPRVGCNAMRFLDYATPLGQPLEQRWINRHRLEKVDPRASQSRVKEPIIYYVDRGAPEAIRNALVEGGNWWAEAFEKAGFTDAYRVEVMPAGAHPLDVRYNMVQWVHRSTRGWSYGGSISDPRTGEIIKGHVSRGSLRVRQDILLFEGLAGVAKTGSGDPDDPVELALARIRQLSAHEIGHTLGFAHNFAASTYDGRASVMDYPAPLIGIENGELDFSDVYGVGIGSWDIHTVRYAYSQFKPNADEDEQLAKIVRDGLDAGYRFMSDSDARSLGSAHPLAHLWDNGDDPVEALNLSMRVRRIALDN
ncbi:MAG: zinc-dependent metalloprotease, partial [Planctomycetota bacterium]|nr:zinc-dependent metalloprotease [Planctomycetota bacterium]